MIAAYAMYRCCGKLGKCSVLPGVAVPAQAICSVIHSPLPFDARADHFVQSATTLSSGLPKSERFPGG